jgi:hypothetical protein
MSIVPSATAADANSNIKELPELIKRWLKTQDEIATLNSEIKQRRTTGKALKDVILRIMETSGYNNLSTSKGMIIHKTRETPEKLSNDYLLKHCKEFFSGDELKAKKLVDYLEQNRATTVKHDLRLQKPRPDDDVITHA